MNYFRKFAICLLAMAAFVLSAAAQDVISTVVGGGPNNLPGTASNLYQPYTEAIDAAGNIYVAAYQQNRIFKISTSGVVTVVAGSGIAGYSGDGGPAVSAELNTPWGVAVDTRQSRTCIHWRYQQLPGARGQPDHRRHHHVRRSGHQLNSPRAAIPAMADQLPRRSCIVQRAWQSARG